ERALSTWRPDSSAFAARWLVELLRASGVTTALSLAHPFGPNLGHYGSDVRRRLREAGIRVVLIPNVPRMRMPTQNDSSGRSRKNVWIESFRWGRRHFWRISRSSSRTIIANGIIKDLVIGYSWAHRRPMQRAACIDTSGSAGYSITISVRLDFGSAEE